MREKDFENNMLELICRPRPASLFPIPYMLPYSADHVFAREFRPIGVLLLFYAELNGFKTCPHIVCSNRIRLGSKDISTHVNKPAIFIQIYALDNQILELHLL